MHIRVGWLWWRHGAAVVTRMANLCPHSSPVFSLRWSCRKEPVRRTPELSCKARANRKDGGLCLLQLLVLRPLGFLRRCGQQACRLGPLT